MIFLAVTSAKLTKKKTDSESTVHTVLKEVVLHMTKCLRLQLENFESNLSIERIRLTEMWPGRIWIKYILQTRSFSGLQYYNRYLLTETSFVRGATYYVFNRR